MLLLLRLFLALMLVSSSVCFAAQTESSAFPLAGWVDQHQKELSRVAQSQSWLRLLHFKKWLGFGWSRSRVDGPEFFFSPNGHRDPYAELIASLAAFLSPEGRQIGGLQQPPQCAFPERYRYLKREFALEKYGIQDEKCEKLEEFLNRFNAQSATLVYSSAYPNNPGSMFGHTLLRINSKGAIGPGKKKLDLLDYGFNYAAQVRPDENGFAFAWFGLTGGYVGEFSMVPYYVKVKEYNHSESRDLWEYDLALTPEQTLSVLRHFWELQTSSYLNYYFFDENCSFILLAVLEVARPDWNLTDFPIYVIPAETIKKVASIPGAITGIKFRPSLQKKMNQRYSALNPEQKEQVNSLISGSLDVAQVSDSAVIDSLISYQQYAKQRADGKLTPEEEKAARATLIRRSELPVAPNEVRTEERDTAAVRDEIRPDLAHHTWRLGVAGGVSRGSYFQEFSFKTALHDLLNDDAGYLRFSQVDFPAVTLRHDATERQLRLEELNFLTITSIFPLGPLEKRPSWNFGLRYHRPADLNCGNCHLLQLEGGIGAAYEAVAKKLVFYSLLLANFEAGSSLGKHFRAGPELQLALLAHPFSRYKTQLIGNYMSDLAQSERQKGHIRAEWNNSWAFSQAWDARFALQYILKTTDLGLNTQQSRLTLNYYF